MGHPEFHPNKKQDGRREKPDGRGLNFVLSHPSQRARWMGHPEFHPHKKQVGRREKPDGRGLNFVLSHHRKGRDGWGTQSFILLRVQKVPKFGRDPAGKCRTSVNLPLESVPDDSNWISYRSGQFAANRFNSCMACCLAFRGRHSGAGVRLSPLRQFEVLGNMSIEG